MKLFLKGTLLLLSVMALFIISCQKQLDNLDFSKTSPTVEPPVAGTDGFKYQGNPTQLGTQLENPYAVKVMANAYETVRTSLSAITKSNDPIDVRNTHFYVRFLPSNWVLYDSLKKDKSLKLYDYPLDYNISQMGDYYHDPTIPLGNPTWQYAAVLKDYVFRPDVPYEILEELYIPEEDSTFSGSNRRDIVEILVNEAMRLTNNLTDAKGFCPTGRYTPSGSVFVWDDLLRRHVALEGAIVRMRQWFCVYERTVGSNGTFTMNETFCNPVRYSIDYDDDDFDIRSGTWGQATLNGPHRNSTWHVSLGPEDRLQRCYAYAYKAAHTLYRANSLFNINKPPTSFWYSLKIGVYDDFDNSALGDYAFWRWWLTFPQIRLYAKTATGYRASNDFLGTAFHEIGHSIHWDLPGRFLSVDDNVAESWARVIQWVCTNNAYRQLGLNINHMNGLQELSSNSSIMKKGYTPLFIDLIDTNNQRGTSGDMTLPPDNVTGFTLNDIQNSLIRSRTFSDVRDKLIALNRAPTADVQALFDFYINNVTYD